MCPVGPWLIRLQPRDSVRRPMPAVIVESKEPLRVSVSNVNPIASGVVHAMTRPEAFVIIFFMLALDLASVSAR
ncbi:Uncharacterised protein [Acinetobacter baumannii]|nr:Uncharacterised protein [Acinetobacter baumannii]